MILMKILSGFVLGLLCVLTAVSLLIEHSGAMIFVYQGF